MCELLEEIPLLSLQRQRLISVFQFALTLYYTKITLRSRVLTKQAGCPLVKKFPEFNGTRKFVTTFETSQHLSLSEAK